MATMEPDQLTAQFSAYIDGELTAKEREDVERILKDDAGARRILDELRQSIEALSSLPRHAAPDSIAEDVQFHVERSALLSDTESSQVESRGRRIFVPAVIAMAAVIGLSVGGLWIMMGEDETWNNVDHRLAMGPQEKTRRDVVEGGLDELSDGRSRRESKDEKRRLRADKSSGASAHPNISDDRLALAATMDQKIRASMPVSSVQNHSFDNEQVRLRMPVRDKKESLAVAAGMLSYLRGRGAVNLADAGSSERSRPVPSQTFYLPGKRGVNFDAADQRQVLVRVSRSDLSELVSKLAGDSSRNSRVALTAGPVSIRGARRVRSVLSGLGDTVPDGGGAITAEKVADARLAGREGRTTTGAQWLEALFHMSQPTEAASESRTQVSEGRRRSAKAVDQRRAKTQIAAKRRGGRSPMDRPAGASAPSQSDRPAAAKAVGKEKTRALNRVDMAADETYITLIVEIAVEKTSHDAASPTRPEKPRSRPNGARGEKVPNG